MEASEAQVNPMQVPQQNLAVAESDPDKVSADMLRSTFREAIQGKDISCISLGEVRRQVATKLGFSPEALDPRKKEFAKIAQSIVQDLQRQLDPSLATKTPLEELLGQAEKKDALQWIYLITMSRVLHANGAGGDAHADLQAMTRKAIAEAVLDSFCNPSSAAPGAAGRPRGPKGNEQIVALLVVFKEAHADGAAHFHVVVKLTRPYRFLNVKRALRERHSLPSHFSCSHTQLWSCVRYGYVETPAKPEVDDAPWLWTPSWTGFARDQVAVDLFALSQQPFTADAWRRKRETTEKEASKKKGKTVFTKLDLTSVIISKHLWSKDALMAYSQEYGTHGMKNYVHNRQRKLVMDIEDAKEWVSAQDNAKFEATDDWTLLNRCAQKACPHGEECTYKQAVEQIFARNAATVSQSQLATALRNIICSGPKKTVRVPFLVGPSNSGKSTLMYPFDDLFTPQRVLHKPAIGSSFGLRNLVGGGKRFIFWDDYRPVEFAHEKTVPVSLFLSLFVGQHCEVQVSQSFNDGNKDIQWKHGVVFTGKEEGMWEPTKFVSPEDIRHMRNRVVEFRFSVPMLEGALKDVISCPCCMARWIVNGSFAGDAALALQPVLPVQEQLNSDRVTAIAGFKELMSAVKAPVPVCEAVLEDLEGLGAARVSELTSADWESLNAWSLLRPLQKRRLLQQCGAQ